MGARATAAASRMVVQILVSASMVYAGPMMMFARQAWGRPSETVRSHGWRHSSVTGAQPSAHEAKLHATTERPQSVIAGRTPQGCRRSVFWKAIPSPLHAPKARPVRIPPHSEPRHPTRRAQKPAKRLPGPPALPHDLAHAVRRALPDDLPAHRQLLRRPTWPGPTGSPGLHRAHATTGQRHVRGSGQIGRAHV